MGRRYILEAASSHFSSFLLQYVFACRYTLYETTISEASVTQEVGSLAALPLPLALVTRKLQCTSNEHRTDGVVVSGELCGSHDISQTSCR
jgi:hypothetical protein